MFNVRRAHLPLLAAASLAAASLPGAAHAAQRSSSLVLINEDGVRLPAIDLSDVQVSLSSTTAGDSGIEAQDQMSLSLDTSVLTNSDVMGWIGKSSAGASLQVTITSAGTTTLYLLNDVVNRSMSISHSSGDGQVMLSIGSKHLTVNGIKLN